MQQPAKTRGPAEGASFSMLALFKNEGDILWEWSRHYLHQGATQIILINNNSSDDWRGALGELGQDRRIVCLEDGPGAGHQPNAQLGRDQSHRDGMRRHSVDPDRPRCSPAKIKFDQFPSSTNLIDANRPRGLTRESWRREICFHVRKTSV